MERYVQRPWQKAKNGNSKITTSLSGTYWDLASILPGSTPLRNSVLQEPSRHHHTQVLHWPGYSWVPGHSHSQVSLLIAQFPPVTLVPLETCCRLLANTTALHSKPDLFTKQHFQLCSHFYSKTYRSAWLIYTQNLVTQRPISNKTNKQANKHKPQTWFKWFLLENILFPKQKSQDNF